MANTTNYNWETPDDTDLVKDGAAAIRTLGNSIDTTTKNLNPETTTGDIAYRSATANTNTRLAIGSTGQVLTVAAGVPSWATPSDQTPLTTKGDVFTFSTVDARLGVGANGTVLTADSAEATGLKWAAPSSTPDFKGFSAYLNTAQTPTNGVNTKLAFSGENFDTEGWYDATTNYRFTPTTAGYYKIDVMVMANSTGRCRIDLYKNGSSLTRTFDYQPAANLQGTYSAPFYSNGTDYWEVYIFQAATSGAMQLGADLSVFSATYLGA